MINQEYFSNKCSNYKLNYSYFVEENPVWGDMVQIGFVQDFKPDELLGIPGVQYRDYAYELEDITDDNYGVYQKYNNQKSVWIKFNDENKKYLNIPGEHEQTDIDYDFGYITGYVKKFIDRMYERQINSVLALTHLFDIRKRSADPSKTSIIASLDLLDTNSFLKFQSILEQLSSYNYSLFCSETTNYLNEVYSDE